MLCYVGHNLWGRKSKIGRHANWRMYAHYRGGSLIPSMSDLARYPRNDLMPTTRPISPGAGRLRRCYRPSGVIGFSLQ